MQILYSAVVTCCFS